MAKPNEKYLKWLSPHPAEEAWKRIVADTNATIGTAVDPEKFLKSVSPLPHFNDRTVWRGREAPPAGDFR
jgi:hypothetical protein